MSDVATTKTMSADDFLAWEREQPERHVYFHGEVFAMAGGSPRHSGLAARIIARLEQRLGGGACNVHTSDLRLGLDGNHFGYADVAVVCGRMELRAGTNDVVTNPAAVVEVLSKTTEAYDRGDKQAAFLRLPSLKHFVLVAQREARVEVYSREPDGSFRFRVHGAGETARLEHLGFELAVDDLYAGMFQLPGDDEVRAG